MRGVIFAFLLIVPGCSLVFGSSRHTEGDAGTVVSDVPTDTVMRDAPDAPCTDGDGDGVCRPMDCDDSDPDVYPGAPPLCANGIRESCETPSLQPIADYFLAQEVGFTLERTSIGASSDRLAFVLLPGTYSAISGFAAFHNGTTWAARLQNLTRGDIVGEMGLLPRDPSLLLGSALFDASLVALAPSYDGNGSLVRVGLVDGVASTAVREIGPFADDERGARMVPGPPSAAATALVTNGLGTSEATHVVYITSPAQFLAVDAATDATTNYANTPVAGFSATDVRMRSSVDGAVLVQDVAMPRHAVVLRVPGGLSVIDDANITGPIAPLSAGALSGSTAVYLVRTADGAALATLDCSTTPCVLENVTPALTTTDQIVDIVGAPYPANDFSAYRGAMGIVVVRRAGADTLSVVFSSPTGAMALAPFTLPLDLGGTVREIRMGVERESYMFAGAGTGYSLVNVVAFAAIVDTMAGREFVMGSMRACELM